MKLLPLALSLLLVFGSALLPCRAQLPPPAKQPVAPAAQLTFLPLPGLTLTEKNTFQYQAGAVDTVRTPHWERAFIVKNTTSQPITISRLRASCGCETLLLLKNGAPVPATHLAPGEQATIHLTVSLHTGQTGPALKYVWIDGPLTAARQSSPLATLQIILLLQQSVFFTPSFLNFGKVGAGGGANQSLTLSFDPDLLPNSGPPVLGSAAPDVQARPFGPLERILVNGKSRMRQTYQVTLAPSTHAGHLSDLLWLELPVLPGGSSPAPRITLSVTGDVAGALDALPASVFFGSLPVGTPVTRTVVLSLAPASVTQSLSVTSSSPWLHAALDSSTGGRHHLLSVTLTAQAPLGSLQGKVTVTLSNGEHLDIPVIAELTK